MTLPAWLTSLLRLVVMLCVPALLIVTPLYYFISPAYVAHQYDQPGFPPSMRFDRQERQRLSDVLVNYLRGRASRADMAELRTDEGHIAMRDEEVSHMVDVKRVTDAFFLAHRVAIVLFIASGILLWRGGRLLALAQGLRHGVWVTAGLMLLVILSSLVDFSAFFTRFHQLFFTEGSWLFYADDTLIQLYPIEFWSETVLTLGMTIVGEAVALYVLAALLGKSVAGSADA